MVIFGITEDMFSLLNQIEEFSILCLAFYSGLKQKLISNMNKNESISNRDDHFFILMNYLIVVSKKIAHLCIHVSGDGYLWSGFNSVELLSTTCRTVNISVAMVDRSPPKFCLHF